MSDSIDSWSREQIGKLWGDHRELASDYWGPDRRNGRRSELIDVRHRVETLEDRAQHYLDAGRQKTCLGLAELKRRDTVETTKEKEVAGVKVAEVSMRGVVLAASIPAGISALVSIALAALQYFAAKGGRP